MSSTARRKLEALAYFLGFIACIPLANWMIGNLGTVCVPQGPCLVPVWPWGPGDKPLMAPSGVLMIGLALVLRDLVQRRLGRGGSGQAAGGRGHQAGKDKAIRADLERHEEEVGFSAARS